MVKTATSFGRNGVADWIIQRFTAVILGAYFIFLAAFFVTHPDLDFATWQNLFAQLWMRVFSLLALLSIVAHGWIGLWGVLTDYVTERMMGSKAVALRLVVLAAYAVVSFACLVWGIEILWGA